MLNINLHHYSRKMLTARRRGVAMLLVLVCQASASQGCNWLDTLPQDLSGEGGDIDLTRYGEKQDADGSLDLHGMQFRVPELGSSGERVLMTYFKVVAPSTLKIKCLSPESSVQCNVRVSPADSDAGDAGDESDGLLHVGGSVAGTVLFPVIQPKKGSNGQRHIIRLEFSVPQGTIPGSCLSFEFMVVLRPIASVDDELRCPSPLPSASLPPRQLTVGRDGSGLHLASDQFLITNDDLQRYSRSDGSFVYPMSLHVKSVAATLSAQVSFDWIVGDFTIELARIADDDLAGSSGHVLFRSNETEAEDENAQFERSAKLWATVPAGNYRLLLRDRTTTHIQTAVKSHFASSAKDSEDTEKDRTLCVRFAFNLDAEASGVSGLSGSDRTELERAQDASKEALANPFIKEPAGASYLLSVEPATAHDLDPAQPLRMVFSFSTPLARFGKEGDGTPDAGRGGEEGATEVHCSAAGAQSWAGSALCSTVFTLRAPSFEHASSLEQQRGPLGQPPQSVSRSNAPIRGTLTPATIYIRAATAPAAAQIVVTWSTASLVQGLEYVLDIAQDYLKTQDGGEVSVEEHNGGVHTYRAASCNCHGHGRCDVERRCACASGYAGQDCERCSEGHRLSDEGVCEKIKTKMLCTRNTCNGHGSCLMPSSGVVCMCAPGYRDSQSGLLCGACVEGFQGYPNCKKEASEEFKEREEDGAGDAGGCSLPALPRSLNGRGLLETDERASLHLQGDYWLDIRARRHIIHVAISRSSVLHMRVDLGALAGSLGVAVAIERLAGSEGGQGARTDGAGAGKSSDAERSKAGGNRGRLLWLPLTRMQDGGRMASGEGYIEAVLHPLVSNGPNPSPSGAASSQRYRIILAYEVLGEIQGGREAEMCRSIGLQLAITPLDALRSLASQVDASCPSDAASRIDIAEHIDVSSKGWSKNGTFYISTTQPGTRVMRNGKAIQPISIRIPEVPGKVARLSAALGYRFEMSSFGLLLEAERTGVEGKVESSKPRCEAVAERKSNQDSTSDAKIGRNVEGEKRSSDSGNEAKKEESLENVQHKDEWSDWKKLGETTPQKDQSAQSGQNKLAKAYYDDGDNDESDSGNKDKDWDPFSGLFDDDDDEDEDDKKNPDGDRNKRGPERDGAYDFHDLINSALTGLVHGRHGGHGPLAGSFPHLAGALGGLSNGVHVIHLPFGHGVDHAGSFDDAPQSGIPLSHPRTWGQHPFPNFPNFDDDDDDDDDDEDDKGIWGDEADDDDDDDDDRRRRRMLLSAEDDVGGSQGGGDVSSALVERKAEDDKGPVGKISVETMLRPPAAGSEDMFDCRSGRERYNHNVIEETLPPGTYTLWLVRNTDFDEVLRGRFEAGVVAAKSDEVVMRCLAFDLAMSVTFEDPPATPVTCTARTLPSAFHEPGFLGPTGTRVHIQDTFYMRQARLSRRHFIDFTVRGQGPSVLRAHVDSQESVDIRLSIFKLERAPGSDKTQATIVDTESPHVVGGLRGDSILSLLQPGSYKLQLEFLNPGGAPGFPKWDLGEAGIGQGRQGGGRTEGCEVLDLELAILPLEDLGANGWRQDCPGKGDGVDSVPSLQDVAGGKSALQIGDSFNLPAADGGSAPGESLLQRLRDDKEPVFWAQTRNGSRGYVIASYPIEVEALAVLRAGLWSDFVHDDLVLDVVDSAGRLVFTGAHRRSYNHIQSLLQPGQYQLKLRQSMSAAEVLGSKTNGQWIQKTDSKGKGFFFNTVSQTSQWHRPPEMAGSDCARFSFWLSLDSFVATDDCHVAADAMAVPASLDSPGMLGSHDRAYLQGIFSIGGQQGLKPTGEGNSMHQTIRFSIRRPSRIRAIVAPLPDDIGNGVVTELTMYSIAPLAEQEKDSGINQVEQVARGEFLSPALYERDQYDKSSSGSTKGVSLGSRQVLTAVVSPKNDVESGEKKEKIAPSAHEDAVLAPRSFVLRLRHMLPPVQEFKCTKFMLLISIEPLWGSKEADPATDGDDGSSCAESDGSPITESKWPKISEDLTNLFACQGTGGDSDFRCWQDLHGMRVVQSGGPARQRFAINLDKLSHLRIEIGFPLHSVPLLASVVPLGCPDGQGPCSSVGDEGKDEIAPLVSVDRPGSSLLVARWLPRGRYLITVEQQTLKKTGAQDTAGAADAKASTQDSEPKTSCERFSFRFVVEKASEVRVSENHVGSHVQRLPQSLDGVAFLKFGGRAHLWGRYAMLHPGLATQEVLFSLQTASMIRVDAMAQLGVGRISLSIFRLGDVGKDESNPTELKALNTELPQVLQRADVLAQGAKGRYKLVVTFEPSDWSLHPPSRGRVRGSFTMQLTITPISQSSLEEKKNSGTSTSICKDSTLEAKQGDGPFHLFAPHGSFTNRDRKGSLIKVVPLQTLEESVVRVTVRSDFSSSALYTTLTRLNLGSSPKMEKMMPSKSSASSWVCIPGYNTCQLDAVVPAGEYNLAFYQPAALSPSPSSRTAGLHPAAKQGEAGLEGSCVRFSLRIQMHATRLKYGMACHGARMLPADLSNLALASTTTNAKGKNNFRAALTWADAFMLVPEVDAGQVDVRDTVLVSLPDGSAMDSYLLHVRHRDARPYSKIEIVPFTSFADSDPDSEGAIKTLGRSVNIGSDGGWETLFTTSHLAVDQESLFLYKGIQGRAPGQALTLGLRVSTTLAFRHESCPTWGLSVNLQKEMHVRRAGRCPPGAGKSVPANNLAVNPSGFGFEELDTFAPVATWPPRDSSCPQDGSRDCRHTADTILSLSIPSLLQASLGFDGALASYSIVLIAVNQGEDASTVISNSVPVFHSEDKKSNIDSSPAVAQLGSMLTRVALSQELPAGKYVVRIARKNALASSISKEAQGQEELCSPILWRIAVSPLLPSKAVEDENMQQRPFVLDVDPPGLHNVPRSVAEIKIRLTLSEPLAPGSSAGGVHVCPKDSVPSDVWLQDTVEGGGGGMLTGASGGCFAVSWIQEVGRDGQEVEGEARGWELHLGIATANMLVSSPYVIWFKGNSWPRGALSGMRFLQPPPFSLSVAEADCSGHGMLASDGTCDCESSRAGFFCGACDASIAPKDCAVAVVPDQDSQSAATPVAGSPLAASSNAAVSTGGPAPDLAKSADSPLAASVASSNAAASTGGSAPAVAKSSMKNKGVDDMKAVPGWVASKEDKKYSSRIRDDGAVDADSVVDLDNVDDRSKLGAQKRGSAIAAAKVKESIAATPTSAAGTSNEAGTDGRKRNIICQLIGCGKKSAWALAAVSGVLAVIGFSIGIVSYICKRRRRGALYGRVRMEDDDL